MALLIRSSSHDVAFVIRPANGKHFTLEEMQRFVSGWIERVPLAPGLWMVVNEEGRLHDLPLNPLASRRAGQVIVGDVLICTDAEFGEDESDVRS